MVSLHFLLATAFTHAVTAGTLNLRNTDNFDLSSPAIFARSDPVVLKPIRNTRRGNSKRDLRSALALKSEEIFYWQGVDGTVAKFNLKTPGSNENIVNLEAIDDLIQKVTCPPSGSESGQLNLQFAKAAGIDNPADVWDWVNQDEDNHFLMIVGEGDCGFNDERILYNVTDVAYDDKTETASLKVKQTTWKTAAKNFDLTVGKRALPPPITASSNRRRRGLFDGLGDIVDKVGDKVTDTVDKVTDKVTDIVGKVTDKVKDKAKALPSKAASLLLPSASFTPEFSIPFAADGLSGKTLTFSNNGLDTSVTCVDCSTSGSISIEARFSADDGKLTQASIDLSLPEDLIATAILSMALKGDVSKGLAVSKSVPIFEVSPAGIVIPGIMTIGPTVAIKLGAEINEIKGAISMTLGGTATLPKGSSARLDFLDEDKLSKKGWEVRFKNAPFKADASVTASAGVFLRGSVGVEVSVIENGFSAQLTADLPNLSASLKAVTSATCSACGNFQNGLESSIGFSTSIGVSLTRKLGGVDQNLKGVKLSQSAPPIASSCLGFGPQGDQCRATLL
ncbi:hypothetical protein QBC43DRAFT_351268 [Cladorrhinum sp. PSN259]|nr:hypothetical protein QBC43DRAFT_351268 [Cladorrhinum sp. PSN259]